MPTGRRLPRIAGLVATIQMIATIPACRQPAGARPYTAARPTYTAPGVRALRIGGYAGSNYGQGPRLPPVEEVEEVGPLR